MLRRKRYRPKPRPTPKVPAGFVAVKPRKGQWYVSLDREKLYGQVVEVRDDGTFRYKSIRTGRVLDTDKRSVALVNEGRSSVMAGTATTWEEVQYDHGRLRFVDEVPEGFTVSGNGWRAPV